MLNTIINLKGICYSFVKSPKNNLTVLILYILFKKITYCVCLTSISIYPSPPRSEGLIGRDTVDVFKDFLNARRNHMDGIL